MELFWREVKPQKEPVQLRWFLPTVVVLVVASVPWYLPTGSSPLLQASLLYGRGTTMSLRRLPRTRSRRRRGRSWMA